MKRNCSGPNYCLTGLRGLDGQVSFVVVEQIHSNMRGTRHPVRSSLPCSIPQIYRSAEVTMHRVKAHHGAAPACALQP
jgi:hypothetical protein